MPPWWIGPRLFDLTITRQHDFMGVKAMFRTVTRHHILVRVVVVGLILAIVAPVFRSVRIASQGSGAAAAGLPVDRTDALILQVATKTPSDTGFEKVLRFYGLKRLNVDLSRTTLGTGCIITKQTTIGFHQRRFPAIEWRVNIAEVLFVLLSR